jgi:HTH-type transcriptional regulator, cell division transcriptional repressor
MDEMGDRISRRRDELGLTQAAIARKLGVVRQTVSLWENGHVRDIGGRHLRELARVLQVEPDWILYGDRPRIAEAPAPGYAQDDLIERVRQLTDDERERLVQWLDDLEREQRELYERLRQKFDR